MRWVVFDYGNVISRQTAALPDIAAMLGVEVSAFEDAYFAERERYDRGCGDQRYWQAIGARFGVDVDAALSRRLTEADIDGWSVKDPETLLLLDDLHSQLVPLAVLSNAPSSFGRATEKQPWAEQFRHLVFSGDLRLAKPDAEIYTHLLRTIGARAEECVFFDDRQENVDAARESGMHAELWRGADAAREALSRHEILPA